MKIKNDKLKTSQRKEEIEFEGEQSPSINKNIPKRFLLFY